MVVPSKEAEAVKPGQGNEGIYDTADDGLHATEDDGYKVKPKQADKPPVDGT